MLVLWHLDKLLKELEISGRDLAKVLNRHEASISRLRQHKTLPRQDGTEIGAIIEALQKLSGVTVELTDLLELVEVEPTLTKVKPEEPEADPYKEGWSQRKLTAHLKCDARQLQTRRDDQEQLQAFTYQRCSELWRFDPISSKYFREG